MIGNDTTPNRYSTLREKRGVVFGKEKHRDVVRVQNFNLKLRAFISQLRLYFMDLIIIYKVLNADFFFQKIRIKSEKVIILYNDRG